MPRKSFKRMGSAQTRRRYSSKEDLQLPSVEVPSDLEDEFTPEVDEDGNIWWYVEKLVAKERRYCEDEKKVVWHYLTRFVGHGWDDDQWLTSRQLSCVNLVRENMGSLLLQCQQAVEELCVLMTHVDQRLAWVGLSSSDAKVVTS